MKRVAPGIGLARHVRVSNVWLVEDAAGRRTLIDTGHPVERLALRWHLWRAGVRRRGDLDAVLLTHRHSDHAGNAAWLKRTFDCPVVCHAADAPFLTGDQTPPRLATPDKPFWARTLCRVEDRFPARVDVDEVLADGDEWGGMRVFHTPGHTSGSAIFHHAQTGALFSGDTILAGPPPLRFIERLALCFDEFSEDARRAHLAAREALDALPPVELLCSGHGPAIDSDAVGRMSALSVQNRLPARFRLG